ncbi:hypothetical protein ILYODFUR_029682 [Ilyodon furcidens]|uniref:Concentrative nucleoside transporter C-terminal domain-containing protein n=1 Tax=Ilyodon furcidens TaxID=33524 RepID=A0ABV0TC45_9TELE
MHMLTATLMSAPASLAIAKIFWPEKEISKSNHDLKLIKGENKYMLEAASQGASCAVGVVANIIFNIIAFATLLAVFDAILSWLGGMFDCLQLSFSIHSEAIATYALSGFSNFASLGMSIGALCMLHIPDCSQLLSSEFNNTNKTSSKQLLDSCSQLYSSRIQQYPF